MLVEATTPLGAYIHYSLAPLTRLHYVRNSTPKEIDISKLLKIFKKDIFIDCIAEVVEDANIYYIQSSSGRRDELYYFSAENKMFHGDKVWSAYHDFYPYLYQIYPSSVVETPCWFVGSRNNYTHQLVDLATTLLFQAEFLQGQQSQPIINIYGRNNPILDSLSELPLFKAGLDRPRVYLEKLGTPAKFGSWTIRCIRFKQLILLRHLSVFKAFSLIHKAFGVYDSTNGDTHFSPTKGLLYLARADDRVRNQQNICSFLRSKFNATILTDLQRQTYASKHSMISPFQHIILPPGSDNINGLCFSNPSALLFQMTSVPAPNILDSPFSSYAGLRYLLPFLHRLTFIPCKTVPNVYSFNTGLWSIEDLECLLNKSCKETSLGDTLSGQ